MELLKLLAANEIIAQIITFLVLLFVLRIVGWKKILAFLDERRIKIALEIEEVEKAKAQAKELKDYCDTQLRNIEAITAKRLDGLQQARFIAGDKRRPSGSRADHCPEPRVLFIMRRLRIKNELKNELIDMGDRPPIMWWAKR